MVVRFGRVSEIFTVNPRTCGVGHGFAAAERHREAHKRLRVCGRRLKSELAGHKRLTKAVVLLVRGSSDEDSVFETGARAVAPGLGRRRAGVANFTNEAWAAALPAFLDTDHFADGFT